MFQLEHLEHFSVFQRSQFRPQAMAHRNLPAFLPPSYT